MQEPRVNRKLRAPRFETEGSRAVPLILDITTRADLIKCKRPVFTNVSARGMPEAVAVGIAIFTTDDLQASDIITSRLT